MPVAALGRLLADGTIAAGDKVVAVATGHGLKDMPDAVMPPLPEPVAADIVDVSVLLSA